MRRVNLEEDGACSYDAGEKKKGTLKGNYVSLTVWDKKITFRSMEERRRFQGGTWRNFYRSLRQDHGRFSICSKRGA